MLTLDDDAEALDEDALDGVASSRTFMTLSSPSWVNNALFSTSYE